MKIHHATMPAANPQHVAGVLAEIVGGASFPQPHPPGVWTVYAGDADGTLLEIWPANLRAGVGEHEPALTEDTIPERWPHHCYVSVDADEQTVLGIFEREGWPAEVVHQGPPNGGFALVRAWIDRSVVIEIATPPMRAQYEGFIQAMARRPA